MLVFLDLDGVLRRRGAPPFRLEAHLRARFETVLRDLGHAEVVISSAWREAIPLAEIRAHFTRDIRARIIGATPVLREHGEPRRYGEVLRYLTTSAHGGRAWVALDDQPENYPVRDNILLLDPTNGFDEPASAWLRSMGRRYGPSAG